MPPGALGRFLVDESNLAEFRGQLGQAFEDAGNAIDILGPLCNRADIRLEVADLFNWSKRACDKRVFSSWPTGIKTRSR